MMKKDSRQSIKDMIFNQAASTVDDLYAKRNALLAVKDDIPEDVREDITIKDDQLILISHKELTDQNKFTDPSNLLVNFNSPQSINSLPTDQFKSTDQIYLTNDSVKPISPVKCITPKNDQIKMTSHNKLTIETSQIAKSLGLSGIGALTILQIVTGYKGAYIRTRNLARELGMTYQGLLNQIERLVSAGYVTSNPGEPTLGRWIEITAAGQIALTSQPEVIKCSSSENKLLLQDEHELTSQLELTSKNCEPNHIDQTKLPSQINLTNIASWEKARLESQAEELFYIGLAAKTNPESFSMQTLTLYSEIVKEHGRDWAGALFLILLPKARDNVTGYIFSAYKNGAEPTSGSVIRVKDMWLTLEALGSVQSSKNLKTQIIEAVEKEDTEALLFLTRIQTELKTALRLLSWPESVDSLVEKRESFISTLGIRISTQM
jgi:DNA-binding MarR family transcriptional regulator